MATVRDTERSVRETRDAHYQHEKKGITAVLSPPLERPRAISWVVHAEKLLVATEAGQLIEVDPVFGSRTLPIVVNDVAEMAVSPDKKLALIVERGRRVAVFNLRSGELVGEVALQLLSDISASWYTMKNGELAVVVGGDQLSDRRVALMSADLKRRKIARVPARTAIGTDYNGRLVCARITAGGLHVIPFGQPLPAGDASKHRVRFAESGAILGIAEGGVTIWRGPGEPPRTIMVYDVSAASLDSKNSQVAIGTRSGEVAFSKVQEGSVERARPGKVGGHSSAIRAMAFSRRGRWLATASDELRIWTW